MCGCEEGECGGWARGLGRAARRDAGTEATGRCMERRRASARVAAAMCFDSLMSGISRADVRRDFGCLGVCGFEDVVPEGADRQYERTSYP